MNVTFYSIVTKHYLNWMIFFGKDVLAHNHRQQHRQFYAYTSASFPFNVL